MNPISALLHRLRHRREAASQRVLAALCRGERQGLDLAADARVSIGLLYPILAVLEREELVRTRWVQIDADRLRRLYRITEAGRQRVGR